MRKQTPGSYICIPKPCWYLVIGFNVYSVRLRVILDYAFTAFNWHLIFVLVISFWSWQLIGRLFLHDSVCDCFGVIRLKWNDDVHVVFITVIIRLKVMKVDVYDSPYYDIAVIYIWFMIYESGGALGFPDNLKFRYFILSIRVMT